MLTETRKGETDARTGLKEKCFQGGFVQDHLDK